MGVPMTDLAPHLTTFLEEHLPNERRFSRHTVQSYKECFRLLVIYAAEKTRVRPCVLKIEHLTVALLLAFLESLEKERNNSVGTRNNRLAAIKSFFRYLEYRAPGCLGLALQVRAIPQKRADKPLIDWLDRTEMQAILDAPDTATVAGLRPSRYRAHPGSPASPSGRASRSGVCRRASAGWRAPATPDRDNPGHGIPGIGRRT